MARNLHSKSNESDSIHFSSGMDSSKIDSLFAGLRKKSSSTRSRFRETSERFFSDAMGSRKQENLRELLDQLKARKVSRPKVLEKPNTERFLEALSSDLLTEIDFPEAYAEEVLENEVNETLTSEQEQNSEPQEKIEPVQEESKELFREEEEQKKPIRNAGRQIVWTVFEAVFGILIGLGIIFVMVNVHNPVEKRLVREFQRTIHGKVTYET